MHTTRWTMPRRVKQRIWFVAKAQKKFAQTDVAITKECLKPMLRRSKHLPNLCISLDILCFFLGTLSKFELDHDLFFRAVPPAHVALRAVPGGVPLTALPSTFSISSFWQVFSVIKGACIMPFFHFLVSIWTLFVVATVLPVAPLFEKP